MGGYGSGRTKEHHITGECLSIDLALLRKDLTSKRLERTDVMHYTGQSRNVETGKVTETKHELRLTIKRYAPSESGLFTGWDAIGHLSLDNARGVRRIELPLVTTSPNYGGVRYWMIAPCCGRRVRVVYLPTFGGSSPVMPECRVCLDLHYASQWASYVERHKTYERHLLANYGLWWAAHRYEHEMKEHYLEMTPELWALRCKSVIDWNIHIMKEIVKCDLFIARTNIRALNSLKSEEDRRLMLEHMRQQESELHTGALIRLMLAYIESEKATLLYHAQGINPMPAYIAFLQESERYRRFEQQQGSNKGEPGEQHFEQNIIDLQAILKQVSKLKKAA